MTNLSYLALFRFFVWGIAITAIPMGIFAKRGLLDLRRLLNKNNELTAKIENAKLELQSIEKKLLLFQTDNEETARVVRQTLGYVRDGETVIEFP